MDDGYHFEDIRWAAATEDGEHIVFEMISAAGPARLLIKAADLSRVIPMLLMAGTQANEIRGNRGAIKASDVHQIQFESLPNDPHSSCLLVALTKGSPLIAFKLPKDRVVSLAEDILSAKAPERLAHPISPPARTN